MYISKSFIEKTNIQIALMTTCQSHGQGQVYAMANGEQILDQFPHFKHNCCQLIIYSQWPAPIKVTINKQF